MKWKDIGIQWKNIHIYCTYIQNLLKLIVDKTLIYLLSDIISEKIKYNIENSIKKLI